MLNAATHQPYSAISFSEANALKQSAADLRSQNADLLNQIYELQLTLNQCKTLYHDPICRCLPCIVRKDCTSILAQLNIFHTERQDQEETITELRVEMQKMLHEKGITDQAHQTKITDQEKIIDELRLKIQQLEIDKKLAAEEAATAQQEKSILLQQIQTIKDQYEIHFMRQEKALTSLSSQKQEPQTSCLKSEYKQLQGNFAQMRKQKEETAEALLRAENKIRTLEARITKEQDARQILEGTLLCLKEEIKKPQIPVVKLSAVPPTLNAKKNKRQKPTDPDETMLDTLVLANQTPPTATSQKINKWQIHLESFKRHMLENETDKMIELLTDPKFSLEQRKILWRLLFIHAPLIIFDKMTIDILQALIDTSPNLKAELSYEYTLFMMLEREYIKATKYLLDQPMAPPNNYQYLYTMLSAIIIWNTKEQTNQWYDTAYQKLWRTNNNSSLLELKLLWTTLLATTSQIIPQDKIEETSEKIVAAQQKIIEILYKELTKHGLDINALKLSEKQSHMLLKHFIFKRKSQIKVGIS